MRRRLLPAVLCLALLGPACSESTPTATSSPDTTLAHTGPAPGPAMTTTVWSTTAAPCTPAGSWRVCSIAGNEDRPIDGGGHTWPGGDSYLAERIVGKVTCDWDSSLICEFLSQFDRTR